MAQPKILVGCPVSDYHTYCTQEYLAGLRSLTYKPDLFFVDNSKTTSFFEFLRKEKIPSIRACFAINNVKQKIAASRNILRKKVLDEGYDYFLSLEQDVTPPKNVIETLLQHKKPIVSGVYYSYFPALGKQQLFPVAYRWLTDKEQDDMKNHTDFLQRVNPALYKELQESHFDFSKVRMKLKPEDVEQPQLMKVKQCGLGCVLIHRDVLEKITFRIDATTDGFDDATFCDDALALGYDLFLDTSVKCKHLIKERPWTWKEIEKKQRSF
jgi:GT2 family glycosyltransferase